MRGKLPPRHQDLRSLISTRHFFFASGPLKSLSCHASSGKITWYLQLFQIKTYDFGKNAIIIHNLAEALNVRL